MLPRNRGNQAMLRLLHSGAIQAKLAIGHASDRYEQEANRVAGMDSAICHTGSGPLAMRRRTRSNLQHSA